MTDPFSDPFGDPFQSPPQLAPRDVSGNRIAAGVCGILLGALGIHKFILGYSREGLIMLLVSVLTCGIGAIPMSIIGFAEGIIYLTKKDHEFNRIYGDAKRGWF